METELFKMATPYVTDESGKPGACVTLQNPNITGKIRSEAAAVAVCLTIATFATLLGFHANGSRLLPWRLAAS